MKLFIVMLLWGFSVAYAGTPKKDTDHPLLSRVKGVEICSIDGKSVKDFSAVNTTANLIDQFPSTYEGKVTVIRYCVTDNSAYSMILTYKNLINASASLGGKVWSARIGTSEEGTVGEHVFSLSPNHARGPVVVAELTGEYYKISIIEPAVMEQTITSRQLSDEIMSKGMATVYINFETNKYNIDSRNQVVLEIVKLMKSSPELRLSINGHTDNQGDLVYNKNLSQLRAEATLTAVVAAGGDAGRLKAKGYGSEMPIADNRNEDGRAKNRRVELVKF